MQTTIRANRPTKLDVCETCTDQSVQRITRTDRGMWMCDSCLTNDDNLKATLEAADKTIAESRQSFASIQLKEDVFTVDATPYMQLKAAVYANTSIPADQKESFLASQMRETVDSLAAVILADEQAIIAKRNLRAMWLVNMRDVVSNLRTEERGKYKQYDSTYNPAVVTKKAIKDAASSPKKAKSSGTKKTKLNREAMDELKVVSAKYGLAWTAVYLVVTNKGLSIEAAAKSLAEKMGLPTELPSV